MSTHRIFTTRFSKVHPLYVQKAERKGRSREEVDRLICWLTGYSEAGLRQQIESDSSFETFFAEAPALHPGPVLQKLGLKWFPSCRRKCHRALGRSLIFPGSSQG